MDIARLTVKRFVLQACWWFGRCSQFAFDSRSWERLDGAHANPGLEHRLVLRTCRFEQEPSTWTSLYRFCLKERWDQRFMSVIPLLIWELCGSLWKGRLVNYPKTVLIKGEDTVKLIHSNITHLNRVVFAWSEGMGRKLQMGLDFSLTPPKPIPVPPSKFK